MPKTLGFGHQPYEHALANTSIYGGIEPLDLAILSQVIYKINPSLLLSGILFLGFLCVRFDQIGIGLIHHSMYTHMFLLLVEGSVLSGSLSSLWPASFGLFACLDFGACPFVSLSLPFLGAFFL
jgi:hypothetical protein